MKKQDISAILRGNSYPGRGIVLGRSEDGASAVIAYFIMGRSANSRNRVFVTDGDGIRTQAFDESKMEDPSLIIYAPVRVLDGLTIVTNGDQTDTAYDGLASGLTFEQALRSRTFEPDGPNFTPRISGEIVLADCGFTYDMSILKSNNGDPEETLRFTFSYDCPKAGEGHFIHTYQGDGNPLPSFEGEMMDNVYPKLEALGFRVGKVKRVKGQNGELSGTVLETAPKEGDYLKPDSKIDFVIVD